MKKCLIFLLAFYGSMFFADGSYPENFDFSFRRISPVGGFTYGAINTIAEDSNGFIWFGTVHGLYRYNTAVIQKFVHNPNDSTSIPGNSIRTLFCDSTGTLWIGTSRGLSRYDPAKDQFINCKFQDRSGERLGNDVREIFQPKGSDLFFLSAVMLGKLNPVTHRFERIVTRPQQENFSGAVADSKGRIWIGGVQGTVWLYDSSNNQFGLFCHHRSESIQKLFTDDKGLWIGYNGSGVDLTGLKGNLITHFGSEPDNQNRIHHNRVRDIFKDESGRIWISTYKGISVIDKDKVTNMPPQAISGLPYNSIYKIFRDSKNGIWMGTWSGGLAYRSGYDNRFIHLRKDQSEAESKDEFVSSFAEKPDKTILIGTEFGNLNKLDRLSGRMINLPFETENRKKIDNIKSLYFDANAEILWIGTFLNGLWYQRKHEPVLRQLDKFNNPRISVYALEKSDSGLWIGTYGNGLYHYNTGSGFMKQYVTISNDSTSITSNGIRTIMKDKDNRLWIGTSTGLNQFDPATGQSQRFLHQPGVSNTLSNDEILSLYQDQQGMIWIGTSGGGVNQYDPATGKFKNFQMKDGLVGNDVYGIRQDKNGKLWISTENGISCIDPAKINFRNFYREDELNGNQYNPGAAFLTSSGEILFGNTKGFTLFTPEKLKTNPIPPDVILTSLAVNNIPVDNHSFGTPLTESIQTTDELRLSHQQNSLTFHFVANNFLLPNKNRFKYRLVNYDNKWVDAGTQNYATYTKIPPGSYTFEVIASNNDNLWNTTPTQLKISISPPIWFSWYAYIVYFISLVMTFNFLRKEISARQRFKKELLLERLKHESEARVHEMKLRFFTNISHEFRTPLTLIASPINLLLAKFDFEPVVKDHLMTMQRNSNRLLHLINQLLDIRKLELGGAVFHPKQTDIIVLCKEVVKCFEMEAKDKHIHLSFNAEAEHLSIVLDTDKADKIFFNILSNAMKFTPENGTIGINVYTTHSAEISEGSIMVGEPVVGNIVCIEFSDSGQGILPEELNLIFERFVQGKNHPSSGTGIGLHMASEYTRMHKGNIMVRSQPGSGSTFTVSLPLTEAANRQGVTARAPGSEIQHLRVESINPVPEHSSPEINFTILIIEDNYELRNYLKNLLKRDYRIVTAANGKQGLETALTIIPDLVITDLMMPQMDGLEVCRQLKNDLHSSHIPIIMLTAFNEPGQQIGGFKTGADAYITKPFDENILIAQIENLINSRVRLREVFSVSSAEWVNGMKLLSSDRMLIEKATAIVEKHLNDKTFVVEHLAASMGISTSSMYRKLKILTNQSPTEFVRYIRLKKAIRLMNEGNTNVDEIGYAIGFNSHSYFTGSFKKQFGKTPSEYLNDLKLKR